MAPHDPEPMNGDLQALVLGARSGDSAAFTQIVRQLQDAVVGYAWGFLRDRQRAEDAAQEAFLEAFLRLGELRDPGAFAHWLRRITFSKCNRMLRRKDPAAAAAPAAEVATGDPVEAHVEQEQRLALERAIEKLPEAERTVITLFYMAEMDQAAMSAFLEVPVSTIKNRLSTARRRLQGALMNQIGDEMRALRPSRDERFQRRVALFRAIDAADADAVEWLLSEDRELVHERRRRDEAPPPGVRWGITPLHLACGRGLARIAELLIDAGADLEARASGNDTPAGGTPLHWAAAQVGLAEDGDRAGNLEVVKLLVRRGANVNPAEDQGLTPGAVGSSLDLWAHRDIAEHLVAHGAVITISAAVALEMGREVRALVERDGAVLAARQGANFVDFTPLHVAARKDLPGMVDLLVELGAPLSPTDKLGRTAIDVALLAGNRRAYDRLAARGAEPSPGTAAIAGTIERAEQLRRFFDALWGDVATVERMLTSDPSLLGSKLPNFWEDNYVGGTALHLAAGMGKKEVAELLLSRGASLVARDERYGGTPIDWAEEFDRPGMVALLTGAPGRVE
jgi:RNA polymerase sigma factor (sigma-70 family)